MTSVGPPPTSLILTSHSHSIRGGTCADRLHENGLKSDPLAVRWVHDSIRLTHAVGTRVLLLPFFGKWALQTRQEMEYTGDALRELAPEAEKADVILGLALTPDIFLDIAPRQDPGPAAGGQQRDHPVQGG